MVPRLWVLDLADGENDSEWQHLAESTYTSDCLEALVECHNRRLEDVTGYVLEGTRAAGLRPSYADDLALRN